MSELTCPVNVLRSVDDVLPKRELTSQQKTELNNVAEGCFNVLTKLKETLEKYQELDSDPNTFGRTSRGSVEEIEVGARKHKGASKPHHPEYLLA